MDEKQNRVRQVLIVGGLIFLVAMSYGSGMRARTKELQSWYEKYKVFRQEARVGELALQARDAQIQQLEARRQLDVAHAALEKNDTAAAKTAITEAVTRLQTAQKADAANAADFTGMAGDLSNLDISNASSARTSLESFAAAMDEKFAQVGGFPAPDALSPVTIPPPNDNEKPSLGNDVTRVK